MLSSLRDHLKRPGSPGTDKGLYYPVALTSLSSPDADDPDPDAPSPVHGPERPLTPQAFAWAAATAVLKAITVVLALYGLFHAMSAHAPTSPTSPSHPPSKPSPPHRSCNCGHALEDAQAAGCTYDPVSVAWLPAHCTDAALVADFRAAAPDAHGWRYTDLTNTSHVLSEADVAALAPGHFFSATMRWHVAHCAAVWRGQVRARGGRGVQMPKRFDTEAHVRHCLDVFMDRRGLDEAYMGFGVVTMADGEADTPVKHDG